MKLSATMNRMKVWKTRFDVVCLKSFWALNYGKIDGFEEMNDGYI